MTKKERVAMVEAALIAAHRNRPEIEPDGNWTNHVMAKVHAQGHLRLANNGPDLTQRIVWRFAAVACTLALTFSLYALRAGIGPEQLVLNFLMHDPLALQTISLFML